MTTAQRADRRDLPRRFEDLVRRMAPRAISSEAQHVQTVEMIDRLMKSGPLASGQAAYLETLVQLVQAYEAAHHEIDTARIGGLASLRHLMEQHGLRAGDLGRILGVHPSMGSKILTGERSLTLDHVKALAEHFAVAPSLFLDAPGRSRRTGSPRAPR